MVIGYFGGLWDFGFLGFTIGGCMDVGYFSLWDYFCVRYIYDY